MTVPPLPAELWEGILVQSGPLALATVVARVDVRRVAAQRIQGAWRRGIPEDRTWTTGRRVIVRSPGRPGMRRGTLCLLANNDWCIRLSDRKIALFFLPHPTIHIRFLHATRVDRDDVSHRAPGAAHQSVAS